MCQDFLCKPNIFFLFSTSKKIQNKKEKYIHVDIPVYLSIHLSISVLNSFLKAEIFSDIFPPSLPHSPVNVQVFSKSHHFPRNLASAQIIGNESRTEKNKEKSVALELEILTAETKRTYGSVLDASLLSIIECDDN